MQRKKFALKAHKMLFQLRVVVFYQTLLVEAYFDNQIMFPKCLNNSIYL